MFPKPYQIWHPIYRWTLKNTKWENIYVWSLMPILHLFCMHFQRHYWTRKQRMKFLVSSANQKPIEGKWDAQKIHKKLQHIKTTSIIKTILSKDLNLERSRFKASLYLKQRFKFELFILITSAIGIRFQSQPHFKPKVTTTLCRTEAEWQTLSFHLYRELRSSHPFPFHNYSMTLGRKGAFVI